jgi:hypothetical protein
VVLPGKNQSKKVKPGFTRFFWILAFGNYYFNPVINNLEEFQNSGFLEKEDISRKLTDCVWGGSKSSRKPIVTTGNDPNDNFRP